MSALRGAAAGIAAVILFGGGSALAGQCRDPWVTQAVQQVTGHAPNGSYESGDCSIQNYGGGHWSSYGDLVNKVRAHFSSGASASVGQCSDPWVTQAVRQVTGRAPNGSGSYGECSIYRYGGGHWSSYADLVQKVRVAFNMGVASNGGVPRIANGGYPGSLYGRNGGRVITAGGGNVIAAGGGNVIAAGGGN